VVHVRVGDVLVDEREIPLVPDFGDPVVEDGLLLFGRQAMFSLSHLRARRRTPVQSMTSS
jgi:hypothetical protein